MKAYDMDKNHWQGLCWNPNTGDWFPLWGWGFNRDNYYRAGNVVVGGDVIEVFVTSGPYIKFVTSHFNLMKGMLDMLGDEVSLAVDDFDLWRATR